jgi:hypothetical protein
MHTFVGFKQVFFSIFCFAWLGFWVGWPAGPQPADAADRRGIVLAGEPEKPVYPGFQHRFDGVGQVYRISPGEVVIDDRTFKFTKDATFNVPGRYDVSRAWVREGTIVGFILNARKEIDSLWIME